MVTVRGHSGDVCVLVPDNQIHKLTEFLARSLEAHQLRDRKLPKDGVTLICRSGDGVELQFYPFYGKHPCCMVNVRDKVNGWFLLSITDVPRLIQFLG
jgi:hypothetical protein